MTDTHDTKDSAVESGPVSVLVVDDSALMRNVVGRIVESDTGLIVAGKAMNGKFALQKLERLDPDVIVLDIEMPEMNGIDFLRECRRRNIHIPVIILSSVAEKGARITMEALSLGASDFLTKPTGADSEELHAVAAQLRLMLRHYGGEYRSSRDNAPFGSPQRESADASRPTAERPDGTDEVPGSASATQPDGTVGLTGAGPGAIAPPDARRRTGSAGSLAGTAASPADPIETVSSLAERVREVIAHHRDDENTGSGRETMEVIAVGISTGGPNALRQVLARLPGDLPLPILVVQHMPAGFTAEFAKSLDRICALEVREAREGDVVRAGRVLIAPGNLHMKVVRKPLGVVIHLSQETAMNGHRPSVDVLFESVAEVYGARSIAVIMTGMGRDGATNLGKIHRVGGVTLGQDALSSIVYGMPKVAWELGHVEMQVSLSDMPDVITRISKELCV